MHLFVFFFLFSISALKSIIKSRPCSETVGAEGKRKRAQFRTRTTMDLDPTLKILSSKKVDEYLAKYGVRLSSNVNVKWCPVKTDYIVAPKRWCIPPLSDIGFEAEVLLKSFVHDLLRHFKIAHRSCWQGAVLGFEALCDLFAPDSRRVKDFSHPLCDEKDQGELSCLCCTEWSREADHQLGGQRPRLASDRHPSFWCLGGGCTGPWCHSNGMESRGASARECLSHAGSPGEGQRLFQIGFDHHWS